MKKWKFIKPVLAQFELDIDFAEGFKFIIIPGFSFIRVYIDFKGTNPPYFDFEQGKAFNSVKEAKTYCNKFYEKLKKEENETQKK